MHYPKPCLLFAAVSVAILGLSQQSFAADPAMTQVVVTAQAAGRTGLGQDAASLPAATTVIDGAELATINLGRDISNIFRRVPGVLANNIDQGDTGNGFRMRGFATSGRAPTPRSTSTACRRTCRRARPARDTVRPSWSGSAPT